MSNIPVNWDPNEWEEHIQQLLKLKYPLGDYVELPATDQGDLAIEGFSRDGVAYQCYAAQEPLSTADRADKQRDKITKDIKSFISRKDELHKVFGDLKIRRWLLVVPIHNSRKLAAHAVKKAKEVLDAELPYIADDFCITVIDDSPFSIQKAQLYSNSIKKLDIPTPEVSDEEYSKWLESNSEQLKRVKLKMVGHPGVAEDDIPGLCEYLTGNYISGQIVLDHIMNEFPDIYENIISLKRAYEKQIQWKSKTIGWANSGGMCELLEEYAAKVTTELKNLDLSTGTCLAEEAVGDWLFRCPLSFNKERA